MSMFESAGDSGNDRLNVDDSFDGDNELEFASSNRTVYLSEHDVRRLRDHLNVVLDEVPVEPKPLVPSVSGGTVVVNVVPQFSLNGLAESLEEAARRVRNQS